MISEEHLKEGIQEARDKFIDDNAVLAESVAKAIFHYRIECERKSGEELGSDDVIVYLGYKEDYALKFTGGENFGFNGTRFTYCGAEIYVVNKESYIHVVRRIC